jgi:hypothetical protein
MISGSTFCGTAQCEVGAKPIPIAHQGEDGTDRQGIVRSDVAVERACGLVS